MCLHTIFMSFYTSKNKNRLPAEIYLPASNFLSEKPVFLLTAFSDIWDLWRNLENLHFAFKRYKMNVYGKKISEFMKELANVKRRIFNYRCAS